MNLKSYIKNNIVESFNQVKKKSSIQDVFNYLNMSENEKQDSLETHWDDIVERFQDLIPYFYQLNNINISCEDDCLEDLYENNYETKYKKWLKENFESFHFEDFDIPSWYFFKNPELIKGTFVHYSQESENILKHGFQKGVSDISILGMTTLLGDEYKQKGGFNFAYSVKDLKNITKNRYGENCVMFEGIGVRAYHKIDKEFEVIFNPSDISNLRKCKK